MPIHDATATTGHLAMRVHERGVGETRSCGTGAVAAVLAARVWAGDRAPDVWSVDVPGGRLRVTAPSGRLLGGSWVELAGPAVVVAEGTLTPGALPGQVATEEADRLPVAAEPAVAPVVAPAATR